MTDRASSPVFSILMTSFNYETYIEAAISSVISQTCTDWELIIVDDCSTDNSWNVIQKFGDTRIRSYRQTSNLGACAAYNKALSIARGKFVASLDSDDVFKPEKLERQLAFFDAHPEVDICTTHVTEINASGDNSQEVTPFSNWFNQEVDLNDPKSWLWENHVCHSSAVVRTDIHARIGNFEQSLVYTPDWQFWLRALVAGARFAVLDEPLLQYRNHNENITHKSHQATLLEHAITCTEILFPWLLKQGRQDLVNLALKGFMINPLLIEETELQSSLAKIFFSTTSNEEVGLAFLRSAIQRESDFAELQKERDWLAEKYAENLVLLKKKSIFSNPFRST